jgi:hypothetical protein
MGYLYQPKLRNGGRGRIWWIKYYAAGRAIRESTGTEKETAARRILKQREGRVAAGLPVSPRADRVTVAELLEDVIADYTANGRRSAERLAFSLARLRPVFGARRAQQVGPSDIRAYVATRLGEGAAPATVNRELAALRRAYGLGLEGERIHRAPKIKALAEHNARKGFFEREQLEAVRRHLPEPLRPVATFAFITGWRIRDEVFTLQWRQVDFAAGTVRYAIVSEADLHEAARKLAALTPAGTFSGASGGGVVESRSLSS